jgi:hypothetical protein
MERGPLNVVICGGWKYCSKVIYRPGVYYCPLLSVVRKMSEAKLHVSVEQCIIINFWRKKVVNRWKSAQDWRGGMAGRHCQMLVSISGAVCLKTEGNGGEWTSEHRPRTIVTGENSNRVNSDRAIWEHFWPRPWRWRHKEITLSWGSALLFFPCVEGINLSFWTAARRNGDFINK